MGTVRIASMDKRVAIVTRLLMGLVLSVVLVGGSLAVAEPASAKGGPAAACGRMKVQKRLKLKMCNPRLASKPLFTAKCKKMATASGLIAAGAVAVATTPLDWPGVITTGSFTSAGTLYFCEAGWL